VTLQTRAVRQAGARLVRACFQRYDRFYCRHVGRKRPTGASLARQPLLLVGGEDVGRAAAACRRLSPDAVESVLRRADAICDHVFDLLGSGPTKLSPAGPAYQPIEWHSDFKSRYAWDPAIFFRDIPYGHAPGVDIKVPWELSRFQHLSTLGQAYALTTSPRFATEFVNQIEDWIRNNPVGFGVNWVCTMDVAIRAANWLTAAEYFLANGALEPAFLHLFYSSIHTHARFMYRHLEGGEQRANHYLADVVGLLFIAAYCPFFRESPRWLRFGIRETAREMMRQVYADGCHFEASTCYHRLALELFFFATLLATRETELDRGNRRQAAKRIFGAEYVQRLHRMFTAVLHLLKPNGRMPQIGDNDSGRFLVCSLHDTLDMRYLLALGAVFFEESQFKVHEFGFSEDVLWVFGEQGYETWQALEGRLLDSVGSRSFPQAGWHVMRRGRDYCLVSCGPNGANGRGGHAHNDKLSIELVMDGQDVIVDPGTLTYTAHPNRRNQFRSTGHHNTVKIDGQEQNGPLNDDMFTLPDRVEIRRAHLTETVGRICFEGHIEYPGAVHKRRICLEGKPGRWTIEDCVSCPQPAVGEVRFHLSPQVISRGDHILDREKGTTLAHLKVEGGGRRTRNYEYSPEYGVSVPAQCVSIEIADRTCAAAVRAVFSTPRAEEAAPADVRGGSPASQDPVGKSVAPVL
jgi:uncharacterized heparinase superfamily protein